MTSDIAVVALLDELHDMHRRLLDTAALALFLGWDPLKVAHTSGLPEGDIWDRHQQLVDAGELAW